MSLIGAWLVYTFLGLTGYVAILVWAVRTRQFTELDRQRYIALNSDNIEDHTEVHVGRIDKLALIFLFVLTIIIVATVIWLGLRSR